ncbi:MAG TPA: transcription antitermination factor NusB [Microbacteriaceae bacterium]|nr:transcription antitermination factor NusB [Microbacteriaceae bacterium]
MSARTKARKRAVDMLYAADVRRRPVQEILAAEAARAASEPARQASWLYAREIVDGVVDHDDEIDALLRGHAQGWSLERMPAVDRALLRVAVWEMCFGAGVPAPVAIAEAVRAAEELSTEGSPGFVNGLLARIAKETQER